jgi:hypothetical protein
MAKWWQIGTLVLGCVIQVAAPARASELDAWLPMPPVLDEPPIPAWTPVLERAPRPASIRQGRRGPGALSAKPQDGIFDFMKYLRVPSPRLGNVELSASVGGLHTESEQPSAKGEMGMDGGPGSTFQLAATYLVDRHVSVSFGLNGAQSQVQAPVASRPRPGAMRGFAAIGPSMVQRLVSTSVLPSAAVQYAGPFGLNLSLGVASNPLDASGAADIQVHAAYRTDFRDHRLPALPAPLGPGVGPLANR